MRNLIPSIRCDQIIELPPPFREDYNELYGQYYEYYSKKIGDKAYVLIKNKEPTVIDYDNQRVLDVGADIGSTASFFLERGAKQVIAVEREKSLFVHLENNAHQYPGITPVYMDVCSSEVLTSLLEWHLPDIVKMDCEGCEVHLLDIAKEIIRIPTIYIVEIHKVKLLTVKSIPKEWLKDVPIDYLPEIKDRMIVRRNFSEVLKKKFEDCGFKIVSTLIWSSEKDKFFKHATEIIYIVRE